MVSLVPNSYPVDPRQLHTWRKDVAEAEDTLFSRWGFEYPVLIELSHQVLCARVQETPLPNSAILYPD